ncbi:MAG: hypothetical protein ACE5IR_25955 [bacterium]
MRFRTPRDRHSWRKGFALPKQSQVILKLYDIRGREVATLVDESYGLLGIVYEVTFKVKPLELVAVKHRNYSLDDFVKQFPRLIERQESIMLYLYPFLNKVTVEFLRYSDHTRSPNRLVWKIRNFFFRNGAGGFGSLVTRFVPFKPIRYFLLDVFNRSFQVGLRWIIRSTHTMPADQIVRYPKKAGMGKYVFSFWAFPKENYPEVLKAYYAFCREHDQSRSYRNNMSSVGYRIIQDTNNLFSYSSEGQVVTIDPVSTGGPRWDEFLDAFNEFSVQRGGRPAFQPDPQADAESGQKSHW